MRISPVVQLTFGVLSLTLSLIFIALALGLLPNEDNTAIEARQKMSENLAIQIASLASRNDTETIHEMITAVIGRGHDVLSIGLRKPDGSMLAASPNHEKDWGPQNTESSSSRVKIPLLNGEQVAGTIELLFNPLPGEGSFLQLSPAVLSFIGFMCGSGMLGYYMVLKRSLRELDPGSAFPHRVSSAFNTLAAGVLILDENNTILLANDAFQKNIYGQPDSLLGKDVDDLPWVVSSRENTTMPWHQARGGRGELGVYMSLRKKSGVTSRLVVNATPILNNRGVRCGAMVTFDDITVLHQKNEELNQANEQLQRSQATAVQQNEQLRVLASTDSLTGCLNRRTFLAEAEKSVRRAGNVGWQVSALMLDIDNFKSINDRFGHATGDTVLSGVGDMLKQSCETHGTAGRYGGEEFCIVFVGLNTEQVREMAELIRSSVEAVVGWLPDDERVTISIGFAMLTDNKRRISDLLKSADEALYAAKRQGRNRVIEWSPAVSLAPVAAPPTQPAIEAAYDSAAADSAS